jgi:hypothetical protein
MQYITVTTVTYVVLVQRCLFNMYVYTGSAKKKEMLLNVPSFLQFLIKLPETYTFSNFVYYKGLVEILM